MTLIWWRYLYHTINCSPTVKSRARRRKLEDTHGSTAIFLGTFSKHSHDEWIPVPAFERRVRYKYPHFLLTVVIHSCGALSVNLSKYLVHTSTYTVSVPLVVESTLFCSLCPIIVSMIGQSRIGVVTALSLGPWQQSWRRTTTSSSMLMQLRTFATTKDPSRSKTDEKQRSTTDNFKSNSASGPTNTLNTRKVTVRKSKEAMDRKTNLEGTRPNIKLDYPSQQQYPHSTATSSSSSTTPRAIPVLQPSIYYYCSAPPAKPAGIQEKKPNHSSRSSNKYVLQAMNASALLDPLKYCKTSSRLSSNRTGVSRSISGTDAARRLLRGKKDFILAARSLKNQPALLEGHGVPHQLFQHCIDMADALLLQYSPDAVECTFHNYNTVLGQSKLPRILRIRR